MARCAMDTNGLLVVRLGSQSGTAVHVGVKVGSRRVARIGSRQSRLMSSTVPFKLHWYANFCTMWSGIYSRCKACARSTRAPLR